jgi:hypothetical protein
MCLNAHKKSTAFSVPIITKFSSTHQQISYTEFHPNRTINEGNRDRNPSATRSEVSLSLCLLPRHSKLHDKFVWTSPVLNCMQMETKACKAGQNFMNVFMHKVGQYLSMSRFLPKSLSLSIIRKIWVQNCTHIIHTHIHT